MPSHAPTIISVIVIIPLTTTIYMPTKWHRQRIWGFYRPFHVGVASRLATAIYVAMVTLNLCDNSYSLNDSNFKYESYWPYG